MVVGGEVKRYDFDENFILVVKMKKFILNGKLDVN